MSEREIWDRRYAEGEYRPRPNPSPFLEQWLERVPRGRALDIACGAGRNALLLAENGFDVDAVDVSEVAVRMARAEAAKRKLDINWHVSDVDEFPIAEHSYQLITVFRYRNPNLWPRLIHGLADGGWLIVEHHFKTTAAVVGPTTERFRLDPQELLEAFASALRVIHFTEDVEPADDPAFSYAIARLVAVKGGAGF